MNDQREEFEKWAKDSGYALLKTGLNQYFYGDTGAAWDAWQAAQACVSQSAGSDAQGGLCGAGDTQVDAVAYMIEWDDGAMDIIEAPMPATGEEPLSVTPLYTRPRSSAHEGRVAIPRDVAEAKGMYLVGYSWLKHNAPDELTAPQPDKWISEVIAERRRQDQKWGGPAHDDQHSIEFFVQLIQDYAGWSRVMAGMGSEDKSRRRLIQVAALAVACVEAIDRNGPPEQESGS